MSGAVITLLDCARKAQRRYAVLLVNVIQCHISGTHSGLIMLHYMFTIFSHSKDLHFYLWTQNITLEMKRPTGEILFNSCACLTHFLSSCSRQGRASTPMRFSPWNEAADFFGGGHQSTAMLLQPAEWMIQTNLWSWSLGETNPPNTIWFFSWPPGIFRQWHADNGETVRLSQVSDSCLFLVKNRPLFTFSLATWLWVAEKMCPRGPVFETWQQFQSNPILWPELDHPLA